MQKNIYYNPEMLIWARLNEGLTLAEGLKLINDIALEDIQTEYGLEHPLTETELTEYERGDEHAHIELLELFAKAYHRQLAVFFLTKPPKQDRRVPIGVKIIYSGGTEDIHNFVED